jgi:hypothetical protein
MLGPTSFPDRMMPTRPGIFSFLKRMGASKMISITNAKIITGFEKGRVKFSASFIFPICSDP